MGVVNLDETALNADNGPIMKLQLKIDGMLPCTFAIRDHRWRQNVTTTKE